MWIALLARVALACSCAEDDVVKAYDPVGTDASFGWFVRDGSNYVTAMYLVGEDGVVVPIEVVVEPVGAGWINWAVPVDELAPLTSFDLSYDTVGADSFDTANYAGSYTTGLGPDEMPPGQLVPAEVLFVDRKARRNDSCGDSLHYSVGFESEGDGLFAEYEVAATSDFEGATRLVSSDATYGACFGDSYCCQPLPVHLEVGPMYFWRARLVDLSGNAGEWSAPVQTVEWRRCGCATASPAPWALALVGLLLLGRRARSALPR